MRRSEARADHSDQELLAEARAGDDLAFAALWSRHRAGALAAARSFTDLDAEDLVSEAYTTILERFRRGGGPEVEAFRPYLYTVVRNLARRRGAAQREVNVEDLPELVGDDMVLDGQIGSLEQRMIRDAFKSLPPRWREVLWYAEIEGLSPADIAPIVGLGANATAALAYRAREGLRQAWLQAHVADAQREGECGWVLARIGEHSRDRLPKRAGARVDAHLARCRACRDVALEVGHVNRQLASVLIPATLGGAAGGVWLASAPVAPASAAVVAATSGAASVLGGVAAAVAGVGLLGGMIVLGPSGSSSVVGAGAPVATGAVRAADASSAPRASLVDELPPIATDTIAMPDPAAPASTPSSTLAPQDSASLATQHAPAGLEAAVDGTVGAVTGTVSGAVSGVVNGVSGVVNGVAGVVSGTLDGTVTGVVNGVGEAASSATGGAIDLQAGDGALSLGVGDVLSVTIGGDDRTGITDSH